VDDAVHDGVSVDPAAEPGVPVLLAELGAEDGGRRAVAGLHELEQEAPEELVGAVEQPLVEHEDLEGRVLPRDLALAAGALARLAPELLQVGAPESGWALGQILRLAGKSISRSAGALDPSPKF